MFIFSDENESLNKIELLDSYRRLNSCQRHKVNELVKAYAQPENFAGDKTHQRDYDNWKNQAQQIMGLLVDGVYFEIDKNNFFRLNSDDTGSPQGTRRGSRVRKQEYFVYHDVERRDNFEVHHIIPLKKARNVENGRAKWRLIDDHLNMIYIHKSTHQNITNLGEKYAVLKIDQNKIVFSHLNGSEGIRATNGEDALYTRDPSKIEEIAHYNERLVKSIYQT